jgi:dihydroorotase
MVTAKPAQVFNYGLELGTLRPGREADISIFELREGNFTFVDYTGDKRTGRQRLFPVASMRSGRLFEITEQFHA